MIHFTAQRCAVLKTMDPQHSGQDVLRCHLCSDPCIQLFCALCDENLCKKCAGDHLLEKTKEHKVLPIEERRISDSNDSNCLKHSTNQCTKFCKQCSFPVCADCVSSKEHKAHDVVDIYDHFAKTRDILSNDLNEMEKTIYPTYLEILSSISMKKDELMGDSEQLKKTINEHRDVCREEIETIIQKWLIGIADCDAKNVKALDGQKDEISHTAEEILETILHVKELLKSKNIRLVSEYKSRIAEFRHLPPYLVPSKPVLSLTSFNKEKFSKQFGSLSFSPIKRKKRSCNPHSERCFLDQPKIIGTFYAKGRSVNNLLCRSDKEIWMTGMDKSIDLYNLQGELLHSIQTKSGHPPWDIAMTKSGDLLYADYKERSINIVEKTQIRRFIQLQGWRPHKICVSFSGDLLVILENNEVTKTRVVRYSGSTEKQSIQWDDKGKPLYSSGNNACICENRNSDICVSDYNAYAVVVVNTAGKLQFTYRRGSFRPIAITTDSQGKILTADCYNHCIHILEQGGHILRYINNCHLKDLSGICVDSIDNVFVINSKTEKVKKIQYYK